LLESTRSRSTPRFLSACSSHLNLHASELVSLNCVSAPRSIMLSMRSRRGPGGTSGSAVCSLRSSWKSLFTRSRNLRYRPASDDDLTRFCSPSVFLRCSSTVRLRFSFSAWRAGSLGASPSLSRRRCCLSASLGRGGGGGAAAWAAPPATARGSGGGPRGGGGGTGGTGGGGGGSCWAWAWPAYCWGG
jgi:hypothetical protein